MDPGHSVQYLGRYLSATPLLPQYPVLQGGVERTDVVVEMVVLVIVLLVHELLRGPFLLLHQTVVAVRPVVPEVCTAHEMARYVLHVLPGRLDPAREKKLSFHRAL